jgi:DNA-binding Lrp family transcriptional regulator
MPKSTDGAAARSVAPLAAGPREEQDGDMTTAFVLVDADPAHIESLAAAIADIEGVHAVYSVTGADADIIAMLLVPTVEEVATVVTHGIARLEGVRRTRTAVAFREYSSRELDAAFEDFGD